MQLISQNLGGVLRQKGLLIQEAFPELSDNAREFILTGATDDEWDEYFSEKDSVKRREGE